ncbi:lysozyme inhibitor LprI family protein [Flavisolibacter tropicus]|uniref:Lysozyme inhibitor LprI-like N-terminal domain-containing protein n=1 Tax=Flavisolibacter tropicus TaxID=1492898 RepID=A0A172TWV1_9BACT|nr:lysozyme inhibitor LprI family protein [Flavisolibacter tropicus]ANE51569.1 hypothetical protein SY85_14715 [Flavisolibacter tropicus]
MKPALHTLAARSSLLIAALFLFSAPAFSQTQMELNQQADKKYKKADAELNKVYKELAALLTPERKALLVKAQRAWITFRDTHCQFTDSGYEGGSIQPMIYSLCMQELTEQRTKQLKAEKDEISGH